MAHAHPTGPPAAGPREPGIEHPGEQEVHEAARRLMDEGLLLVDGDPEEATRYGRQIAAEMGTVLVVEPSAGSMSAEDPAEAMRLAVRDGVFFEMRRIARVIAGRITRMERPHDKQSGATSTPPALLELDLETEEDRRTVRLEDAWAWNLHHSGAQEGDVVEIDRDHPLVTVRPQGTLLDGRVLDERDHRLQVSLGAIDRAHAAPPVQGSEEEDPDETILSRAARSHDLMLATGERRPTGAAARAATDAWVRRRLAGRHTRLVPGVLLVLDAASLPDRAASALRAARGATASPWVLLNEEEEDRRLALSQRWAKQPQERA